MHNRLSGHYYRTDIIISGIPGQLENLSAHVIKIAGCLNVNILNTHINYCTHINKKNDILTSRSIVNSLFNAIRFGSWASCQQQILSVLPRRKWWKMAAINSSSWNR
uniref:Uncharacterized protein n=1 Tax=Glossina pallidipes TaxID=7398 RepID=A0A1A9Z5X3_GLOPL